MVPLSEQQQYRVLIKENEENETIDDYDNPLTDYSHQSLIFDSTSNLDLLRRKIGNPLSDFDLITKMNQENRKVTKTEKSRRHFQFLHLVRDNFSTSFGFAVKQIKDSGTIHVTSVSHGSEARKAGLKFSDKIISINDYEVKSLSLEVLQTIIKTTNALDITYTEFHGLKRFLLTRKSEQSFGLTIEKDFNIIDAVEMGSVADQNNVPVNYCVIEVNGFGCVGINNRQLKSLLNSNCVIDIKIIPLVMYMTLSQKF
eukprot:Pgem_evm1s13386